MSARQPPRSMLGQAGHGLAVIAALSAAVNLLVLVSPLYMLQVYDRVLTSFRVETLLYLSLIAGVCVVALGFFDVLRGIAVARLGRWWDETERPPLFAAVLERARQSGPQSAAALSDLQQVRGFVGSAGILPFFDAPWTPPFLLLVFVLHPLLGWLALLSAAALLALAFAADRNARAAQRGIAAEIAAANAFAQAALRNADVVHAMGMAPVVARRHDARQQRLNAAGEAAGTRGALIAGASRALRVGVQIAVLGLGAWLVTRNELTGGGMIAASIILGRALAPIEQGIGAWRGFAAAREAHGRIRALIRAEPAAEPIALPAPQGRLGVEDLSLHLPGQDRPVLRKVGFRLEPGRVLAVVGPSASGKSALCRVLVGSWKPTSGRVRLDGASLDQWRDADRARHIGYLPQATELFGGTVRDNIARLGAADDVAIVDAARMAGCHDMILRLPRGYDTEIGECGHYLSGGQRQRIALARALFGRPRLVVLDEPNASLDQEGETALIAAVEALRQDGAAIVVVSHRAAVMHVADMIAVLRDGALERYGPRGPVLSPAADARRVVGMAGSPS